MAQLDLNPTLARYRTNAIRQAWTGGHEGCRLEVVTHLLYAEGHEVDAVTLDAPATFTVKSDASWEDIKDSLVTYLHCKDHDLEWSLDGEDYSYE